MTAVAAVIVIAVVAGGIIIALGWVQAARTRRATRAGLQRASGHATDAQLLGLITHHPPDERVREGTGAIDGQEVHESVERIRGHDRAS